MFATYAGRRWGPTSSLSPHPNPLRSAPHTWHARIEGTDPGIDVLLAQVTENFANVTAIDVRALL